MGRQQKAQRDDLPWNREVNDCYHHHLENTASHENATVDVTQNEWMQTEFDTEVS